MADTVGHYVAKRLSEWGINRIIETGASYQRQRAVAAQHHGELDAVVGSLVAEMRAGHALPVATPAIE